jgi:HlyD family secretion protein
MMRSDSLSTLPSNRTLAKKSAWRWLRFCLPLFLLVSGGLGLKLLGWDGSDRSQTDLITQPVERKTVPVTITANGTVKAEREIDLSPKTAGTISQLLVKEGDRLRRGQLVAIVDDSNLQGDLIEMQGLVAEREADLREIEAGNRPEDIDRAEAYLEEARANLQELKSGNRPQEIERASARLQQAQATLRQKESDLQRNQQLFKEGALSRQELEQKQTDRDIATKQVMEAEQELALQKAGTRSEQIAQASARVKQQEQTVALLKAGSRTEEIERARARLQSARGSLKKIETEIEDTRIIAPFDGIVTQKFADIGSFVSPSMAGGNTESASPSSILTLSSTPYRVVANLSESQINKIELGQTVTIAVDAFPEKVFTGKVVQISPQAIVSQNVTSFEVSVAIVAPTAEKLKIGMNVEARFAVNPLENVLLVPNAAVVRKQEGEGVYVVDSERQISFQPIETGTTVGSKTQVKSGLKGNEKVLIAPPPNQKSTGDFNLIPKAPSN